MQIALYAGMHGTTTINTLEALRDTLYFLLTYHYHYCHHYYT